ncbi:hypothetical protein E2C01_058726 [Portunus trituberculatus]|uniref:Uncharacterized protein n=1 Tax=Portunus trituberculatus TaxID=210409 RepID=A0A5B7H687_PORTR|nr:hypothetical protein [Portunus trituberculatus]
MKAPKRLISDENKESNKTASVSDLQHSNRNHTRRKVTKKFSWMVTYPLATSLLLPTHLPSSSKLFITSLHLRYVQIKIVKKYTLIFL